MRQFNAASWARQHRLNLLKPLMQPFYTITAIIITVTSTTRAYSLQRREGRNSYKFLVIKGNVCCKSKHTCYCCYCCCSLLNYNYKTKKKKKKNQQLWLILMANGGFFFFNIICVWDDWLCGVSHWDTCVYCLMQ